MKSSLYTGKVFHGRHVPFSHKFTYSVFSLLVDLDELPTLSKKLKFFSFNKWNILSFNNKDHAARDGSDIRAWIEAAAEKKQIDIKGGKIFCLCFPRLWGYVFNPITIYFLHNAGSDLVAILYQVKNTFGEQHGYLLPVTQELSSLRRQGSGIDERENDTLDSCLSRNDKPVKQSTNKLFYVSPFIQMECKYEFRISPPAKEFDIAIHQFISEGDKILTATWNGTRRDLNDWNILKTVLRHPLMTFKVMLGIHWEALFLWWKGAKFYSRKPKEIEDVT